MDPPLADQIAPLRRKAQQYLRSAALLFEGGDYDSCASRAYFAMFYAAQAALLTEIEDLPRQGIRTAFAERFVHAGRLPPRADEALTQAYELQQLGDYARRPAVDAADAERMLQEAEAFVNSLARLIDQHLVR